MSLIFLLFTVLNFFSSKAANAIGNGLTTASVNSNVCNYAFMGFGTNLRAIPVAVGGWGQAVYSQSNRNGGPCITTNFSGVVSNFVLTCINGELWQHNYLSTDISCSQSPVSLTDVTFIENDGQTTYKGIYSENNFNCSGQLTTSNECGWTRVKFGYQSCNSTLLEQNDFLVAPVITNIYGGCLSNGMSFNTTFPFTNCAGTSNANGGLKIPDPTQTSTNNTCRVYANQFSYLFNDVYGTDQNAKILYTPTPVPATTTKPTFVPPPTCNSFFCDRSNAKKSFTSSLFGLILFVISLV